MKKLLARLIHGGHRRHPARQVRFARFGSELLEPLEARLLLDADPIIGTAIQVGTTQALDEISGIAVSRSLPGNLWVHQDSGDSARFYGLNTAGVFHSTVTLSGAPSVDWEDMSIAPKPGGGNYLYFADIGDNNAVRTAGVDIIRVTEPTTIGNATLTSADYTVKRVQYPGGPRNAESLFVDPLTNDLYIITKEPTGVIYRLPAGQFTASGTSTLESLGYINAALYRPTAADISPDGRFIIVRNSTSGGTVAYLFERDSGQSVADALHGTPTSHALAFEPQGESIGWSSDGTELYTISEGTTRPIWYYTFDLPPTDVSAGGPYAIDAGDNLVLSATASGLGPLSYSWDLNDDGTFGDAIGANPTVSWAALQALGFGYEQTTAPVSVRVDNGAHPPVDASTSLTVSHDSSVVTGRYLFYNNSVWDDAQFGFTNSSAIAADKTAYFPGGTSSFANMSSYSKGINGIMVDLSGEHGTLTSDDFTIRMSGQGLAANNAPGTWTAAPSFSVTLVPDTPTSGTDRYELVWPDGAIVNRYLYVLVEGNDAAGGFNTNTGLVSSNFFFFGSLIGDAGGGEFYPNVDVTDQIQVRNNGGQPAFQNNPYDFNRDAAVDPSDEIIARNNQGAMPWLFLGAGPFSPEAAPASAPESDDGSASAVASALAGFGGSPATAEFGVAALLFDEPAADVAAPTAAASPASGVSIEIEPVAQVAWDDFELAEAALDDELLEALLR